MHAPILRATDVAAEVYDDPSEDALYMFMEDLTSPGASFLIERVEPGREEEWARVMRQESGLYEFEGARTSTTSARYGRCTTS